jgi:hypothetical protein
MAGAGVVACGRDDVRPPDNPNDVAAFVGKTSPGSTPAAASVDVQPGTPPVIETNADPCTFFSKAELESAFGVLFAPPKKGRGGEPTCRFYNSITGTVTVRAGEAVTRPQFDSLRTMIGAEAEPVSGVGETAYLWGPKLYALNNGRQLIINVSTDQLTPQMRTALTSLGKLGAPRLRR